MAEGGASAENIQNKIDGDTKTPVNKPSMAPTPENLKPSLAPTPESIQKTMEDISIDLKILNQIKAQQCPEWQVEAPSYDHIPKTQIQNISMARYVAMNTNTILERTLAGLVIVIQMMEESRKRDNGLSVKVGLLQNGQREQNQIIRDLRQELSEHREGQKGNTRQFGQARHNVQAGQAGQTGQTEQAGQAGQTGKPATRNSNDSHKTAETTKNRKQKRGNGNGNFPIGSEERSKEVYEKQKNESEKRFRLVVDEDGQNIQKEEFIPANRNRNRNRFQKSTAQKSKEDKERERNEEETGREIIFDNIPTPKTYQEGTKREEAKRILEVLEELRPKYLGKADGVHVVPSDFAYATRQQSHFKTDFKPLTARFRKKEKVEQIFHAAKVAGMLNKRKEKSVGKYRTAKPVMVGGIEVLPSDAAIQRAMERPDTHIRRSRTEAERERDNETRKYRDSLKYQQSLKVKTFLKEQRVDFEGIDFDPVEENEGEEGNASEYGVWQIEIPEEEKKDTTAEVDPNGGQYKGPVIDDARNGP